MQCLNCGHALITGSEFCGNCGAKLLPAPITNPVNGSSQSINSSKSTNHSQSQPLPTSTPTTPPSPTTANNAHAVAKQQSNGPSIAALVLGILTLTLFWIWFIAVPLGIAAIITGLIGLSKGGKGMAISGLITGIIGLVLAILLVITFFMVLSGYEKSYTHSAQVIPGNPLHIPKFHIYIDQ